ncbi:hypothetical protein DERP_007030 [Dermatophagoides pteronyssinus]|uniref:Uncharacterized protein n=1 Tax=Dermatophagoides pteronyssinus TaxID=6956 RepID=A0ABQ8JUE5_DERPT|nr:hypothetical protein DERP_007030 [Dermatophagoides pteronyssinus]
MSHEHQDNHHHDSYGKKRKGINLDHYHQWITGTTTTDIFIINKVICGQDVGLNKPVDHYHHNHV